MTNPSIGTTTPDLDREERRLPMIGRAAGLLLLVGLVLGFIRIPGYDSLYYSSPSSSQIVNLAAHSGGAIIASHFLFALQATLWGIAFALMIGVLRGRGVLAALTCIGAGSYIALNWASAGVGYAFAEAGRQTDSNAAAIVLFDLGRALGFTDGYSFAMAVGSISALVLLTRRLPRPIGWLGALVTLAYFVGGPIYAWAEGTPRDLVGPITSVLALLWIVGSGLLLLIKPTWAATNDDSAVAGSVVVPPASREGA